MADIIDLDKIGAVRREAKKDRPVIKFGGQEFQLPPEMPFAVVEAVGRIQRAGNDEEKNAVVAESMADIARALFGDGYRKFLDLGPSVEDVSTLIDNIAPTYGLPTTENTDNGKAPKPE